MTIFCALEIWGGVSRDYIETENNLYDRQLLVSTGFWHIMILSLVWCTLAYLFCHRILNILSLDKSYLNIYKMALLIVPLGTLYSYFNVLMRFENKPWFFFIGILIQIIVSTLISLYSIIILNTGLIGFFYGYFLGNFSSTLFFGFFLRQYLRFRVSIKLLKKILSFSLPVVPAVIVIWLNSYSNRFVMLRYLSFHELGVYAVALKVASIFLFLEYALRLAWTPLMYQFIKFDDYKQKFIRIYELLLKLNFIVFFSISVFMKEIISILAPLEYSNAVSIAGLLCIPSLLLILNLIVGASPSISRKTIYDTIAQIDGFLVNIFTMFFTIPKFGLMGAAFSFIFGAITTFGLYFYYSGKLLNLYFPKIKSILFIVSVIIFALIFGNYEMEFRIKVFIFFLFSAIYFYFGLYKDKEINFIISSLKVMMGK
jgi:O-antigen/teichoic acid export membrane protein